MPDRPDDSADDTEAARSRTASADESGQSEPPRASASGSSQSSPVPELLSLPATLSADRERDSAPVALPGFGLLHPPVVVKQARRARRGDIIGKRYIVDGQIAKGGMGRILRVRHQVLGKYFALKVIRAPIATDQRMCEMFYREARLASALEHENICSIVDFGNDPEVGLFMVMELLEGASLHDKLKKDGPMAAKAACAVVWDVGKAIKHMHERSIVHGDIKSSNILLVRTAHKHRMVKLTDFGLARVDIAQQAGHVQGTPEYMAPELIRRRAASPLTDIYALGILFFEVLVGKPPFTGTSMGTTEDVLRLHLEASLPRVSEVIDGGIDARADEIIARATAKNPSDRQPDMDSFLFELRAFMNMLGIGRTYQRPRAMAEPPRANRQRSRATGRRIEGGAEVFRHSPIPLAAVSPNGRVRVANDAFMAFLGSAEEPAQVSLESTLLPAYYPDLMADLTFVARSRGEVKRVLWLRNKQGQIVEVAVILQPGPSQATVTAGDVHLALHPLGRRARPEVSDPK